jgi:hypothetical protein
VSNPGGAQLRLYSRLVVIARPSVGSQQAAAAEDETIRSTMRDDFTRGLQDGLLGRPYGASQPEAG